MGRYEQLLLDRHLWGGTRPGLPDPFSSGDCFDAWSERFVNAPEECSVGSVARARSWLLNRGWRRHGLTSLRAVPGAR